MVVIAAVLGTQGCGLTSRRTGWCQDKGTSSTGNLHRKRRDITEQEAQDGQYRSTAIRQKINLQLVAMFVLPITVA